MHPLPPDWYERELGPGDVGSDVALVQRRLRAVETGKFDPATEARVRGFQLTHHLPLTGLVDLATARVIERKNGGS